jgi:predicted secreted protein
MGQSPEIDTAVDQNTGVPFQYDFRDVYGSVLIDWFEVPEATVQTLFSSGFTYLPIANGCSRPLNIIVDAPAALGDEYFIDLDWQDHVLPRPQGFRLERSEDGRNFQIITRVPAKNSVTGYTFRDEKVRKNKLYYYRLQRENTDRTISTSGVQTGRLRGSSRGDWAVGLPRPNPVRDDGSYIKVYAPTDATAAWSVTDISGRKVRNGSISLLGGQDNRIPLRPAGLPNGTYVWQLITENGQRFSRKMLRQ